MRRRRRRRFGAHVVRARRCQSDRPGRCDSLRLEAGLRLYGHDIDTTTTPIEAGLLWSSANAVVRRAAFPAPISFRNKSPMVCRAGGWIAPAGRAPIGNTQRSLMSTARKMVWSPAVDLGRASDRRSRWDMSRHDLQRRARKWRRW